MIEAEIKFKVDGLDEVEKKVKDFAEFVVEKSEKNIVYQIDGMNFRNSDEALRIRKDKEGISITYKGPKMESRTKTRKEVKIRIDNYDSGIELLESLGFYKSGTVVKKRRIYRKEDIIICLDSVEKLGNFVEIEVQTEPSNLDASIARIFEVAKKLGFNENQSIRKSYLELLTLK